MPPKHNQENRYEVQGRAKIVAAASLLIASLVYAGNAAARQRRANERAAFAASIPKVELGGGYPRLFFQKGVNFTAEGPDSYQSAKAVEMLDALLQYGVDAVALVPYGFTPRGSPTVRARVVLPLCRGPWRSTAGVSRSASRRRGATKRG